MSDDSATKASPERIGLVITNLTKLGGIVIALNEVFSRNDLRPGAIGIAALMMAGAQSLESFLTSFFGSQK